MKSKFKKVLIVDDAQDYRVLLSKAFKQEGYKIYLAQDGITGYVKFFKIKPDIMIIDILLPKMRGDTLIKWLKGTELGKDTPVIVISGHAPMKDYVYQLGIELFFDKPCKVKEVLSAAKEIFAVSEGMKDLKQKLDQLKLLYDRKYFEKKYALEEEIDLGEEYKFCARCHKSLPMTAALCPRCGNMDLEPKYK